MIRSGVVNFDHAMHARVDVSEFRKEILGVCGRFDPTTSRIHLKNQFVGLGGKFSMHHKKNFKRHFLANENLLLKFARFKMRKVFFSFRKYTFCC